MGYDLPKEWQAAFCTALTCKCQSGEKEGVVLA